MESQSLELNKRTTNLTVQINKYGFDQIDQEFLTKNRKYLFNFLCSGSSSEHDKRKSWSVHYSEADKAFT